MSDLTPGRADQAIATVLGAETQPPVYVYAPLNHAESSNRLLVGFEDCECVPAITDLVTVCDTTAGRLATAEVVGIDERDHVIRIAVDWLTLREAAQ